LKEIIDKKRSYEDRLLEIMSNKDFSLCNYEFVYNEKLKRKIPLGWEIKTIEQCVKHINTGLNPRDNFILNTGNIRYITVKNLTTTGSIDFTDCDTIDSAAHRLVHKRSDIQVGDILFASIAPLGRCHLIMEEPRDWDINESVFSVRPNTDIVTPSFLYMLFTDKTFVKKAMSMSTGSIFKGIRISELLNIKVLIPPLNMQKHIEEKIMTIFNLTKCLGTEMSNIDSTTNYLFPLIMNGKIN
jgi:type I restriction enzyme S subunit